MNENRLKQSSAASQAAFLNRPESSQMAGAGSNSTWKIRKGREG
ncbi:MAG: hypothetical protein ACYTEL_17170 [Planctomycetota bacterium]